MNAIEFRRLRRQAGITLVECCTVVALLAVLVGAAVPSFSRMIGKRFTEGVANELVADLNQVRAEAVARHENLRMAFSHSPAGTCYVVHTGSPGECSCTADGATVCRAPAKEIKTARFAAGGRVQVLANVASMGFDGRLGTTSPGGTIRVIDASGAAEIDHIVGITGRARTCSKGAIASFKPC